MDPRSFVMLYKAMARPVAEIASDCWRLLSRSRPHVEYSNSFWPPSNEAIEKTQKRTTKLLIATKATNGIQPIQV